MFSKPNKTAIATVEALPQVGPSSAARGVPRVASLVAGGLVIEGGLSGDVELHVDGAIRGDVRVARLTIGESGCVEGSIDAEAVECRGRVIGSINAAQVRLYGAAHVDGDITNDQLTIETGAFFQGRSLKAARAMEVAVIAAAE